MKSTLIVPPLTLVILSIEIWINLRIEETNSLSQSTPEFSRRDGIGSLPENIIDAIFRPELLASLVIMLGCLIYADKNAHKFSEYMDKLSVLGGVFLFPISVLVLAAYSLIDSLLIFSGSGSAIRWMRNFLENTFVNDFIRDVASFTILFLIFIPPMLLLATLIYGKRNEQKG